MTPAITYDPQHGDHVIVTPRYRTGPDFNDRTDAEPWVGTFHIGPGHRKLIDRGSEVVAELRHVACTVYHDGAVEIVGLVDGCVEGSWRVEPFVASSEA
jgi:hypothetical protein